MNKKRSSLLLGGSLWWVLAFAEVKTPPALTIQIEAQPIASALGVFVQQSGLQVLFPADDAVKFLVARPVNGVLTADAALSQLLASSGLSYEFVNPQTVAIRNSANIANEESSASNPITASDEPSAPERVKAEDAHGIPEVLVRGARSLNADIERTQDDIQPYVVLDRQVIERAAAKNVEDLLRSQLTMNYAFRANDQVASGGSTSTVALRGLSSDQTLILIDGRRASVRGVFGVSGQADLNGIPLSAVERIEILPATASGIYGGSATGGVINVILRRDYSGVEAAVTYEDSFRGGGGSRRVDLHGGYAMNGGKTSFTAAASYSDRNTLRAGQRDFYADYRRRSDENARRYGLAQYLNGGVPTLGATTNISSLAAFDPATGTAVAPELVLKAQYGGLGIGAPITSVPLSCSTGQIGSECLTGLQENAGRYNADLAETQQLGGRSAALLNDPSIQSLSLTLRHSFSKTVEAFLSLDGSKNYGRFSQVDFPSTFLISADADNNPFDQPIFVNVPIRIGNSDVVQKNKTTRALFGVKVGLPGDWGTVVEYSIDRADLRQSFPSFLSFDADLDIFAGTANVLVAPPSGGFDFSNYALGSSDVLPSHTILKSGSIRTAGPLFQLPAGPLMLTTLLEHNRQSYSQYTQAFYTAPGVQSFATYSPQSSTTTSLYAEVQLPVVSDNMSVTALRNVSLQLANRYESYKNIGGSFLNEGADPVTRPRQEFHSSDPTFGVRIQPIDSVTFRASYGTGFFPPALSQLVSNPPQLIPFNFLADPKRGNETVGNVLFRTGGSIDLDPEKSKTRSLGVILTPPLQQLRISFDWTRIEKRNNISSISLDQFSLSREDELPGVITRSTDPATFNGFGVGPIVEFNAGLINATRASSESYDIAASYLFDLEWLGGFELYANATRLVHNERQLVPAGTVDDVVGINLSPSWQGNASLTWRWRSFSATWATRYLDAVWVDLNRGFNALVGSDRLPSETYHDLAIRYDFDRGARPVANGGSVQLGIKNIFDTKPRFDPSSGNLYDYLGSPMLETYYFSLTTRF